MSFTTKENFVWYHLDYMHFDIGARGSGEVSRESVDLENDGQAVAYFRKFKQERGKRDQNILNGQLSGRVCIRIVSPAGEWLAGDPLI